MTDNISEANEKIFLISDLNTFLECADRAVNIYIWRYIIPDDGSLVFNWHFTKISTTCWNMEVSYLWISWLYTNIGNISGNLEQFSLYIKIAILYLYKLLTFKILSSENSGSVWVLGWTPWIIRTIFFCNTCMINLLKWLWSVEPHTCIQYVK